MSVGSWTPEAQPQELTRALLQPALTFPVQAPFPEQAPSELSALQSFAKSSQSQWLSVLTELDSSELQQLCHFFTLAEKHWSDWFGGDKNPVIWICKELKKRGEFPNKELMLWIKEHSDNRFLPYGNLLG